MVDMQSYIVCNRQEMSVVYLIIENEECLFNQKYLNINTKIFTSPGAGSYLASPQAFLFSVVNPHRMGPTKLPLTKNQNNAICSYRNCGPTFGGGHDLHITENANSNNSSYSNLGFSYECPSGKQNTFFTGVKTFSVTDYEVFGLQE